MDIKEIHGFGYRARINLSRGANCIGLCYGEHRLLREPDYEELDNPFLYGMPILFPVNRISGGEFVFDGRRYTFPINEEKTGCHLHGMLHEMPFRLTELTDSSLCATFHAERLEYLGFLHSFEIVMRYSLSEDGLLQSVTVKNLSDEAMPALVGFHTTFNSRPFGKDIATRVLVDIETEYERNMENYLPTGRKPVPDGVTRALMRGEFDPLSMPISRHYRASGSGRMAIISERYAMLYEICRALPFRLIYGGGAAGYICLEPQTSLANSPNSPISRGEAGFNVIAQHSEQTFTTNIKIIDLSNGKDDIL